MTLHQLINHLHVLEDLGYKEVRVWDTAAQNYIQPTGFILNGLRSTVDIMTNLEGTDDTLPGPNVDDIEY